MLGFVVIVILYAVIGLMAAAGASFIAPKILAPKAEQIFYAMFLIMIAAFYLAFTAYFGVATAWPGGNGCRRGICRDRPVGCGACRSP